MEQTTTEYYKQGMRSDNKANRQAARELAERERALGYVLLRAYWLGVARQSNR